MKPHRCTAHITIISSVNNGPPSSPLYTTVRDGDIVTIVQPVTVTFAGNTPIRASRVEQLGDGRTRIIHHQEGT